MAIIYVKKHGAFGNGTGFSPSAMTWGLQDISASDSGRTNDTKMHKNRVGQKRKLTLTWNGVNRQKAAEILQAFNHEYIDVTYPDAMTGTDIEKTFYRGDPSAPFKIWTVNKKLYTSVSFSIIEQ